MPVTMKEIAKIAGVSQPAVSVALSSKGTTKVSEEMRRKILRIAEELNYMPNNAQGKGDAHHRDFRRSVCIRSDAGADAGYFFGAGKAEL